jgi:uncharacterized protein (TIGR02677 family)
MVVVEGGGADVAEEPLDAEDRLRRYSYLTTGARRTHFAIMRVFSSTLLADLSAADVSKALGAVERAGQIDAGESSVDHVLDRLAQLTKWGNLVPGRRETNARSIAEFAHGSVRYQVDKLALRIHREAEALLAIPEGAREVSRELLPAIRRGLDDVAQTTSLALADEHRFGPDSTPVARRRDQLSEQVTTLFLQHGELAATVRDFYAHVGLVVARHDLDPEEIAGFRGLLVEYIQLVVDEVLRHTAPIAESLRLFERTLPEVLRLLAPTADLGESVERGRGKSFSDWRGLTDWFVDRPGQVSQVGALREATARAVGSLLTNVKRATGGGGIALGRRAELIRLARRFDASTVDDAHAAYAESFGLWPTRHWLLVPDMDDTLPTTSWREGMRTPVSVSTSARGDRAARGRISKIMENPIGEQMALTEAQEQASRREAAYAELRAAAARLEDVTLSAGALDVLYDLLRRALSQREGIDGGGEFLHTPSRLRVRVVPEAGTQCHISAAHGTLTLQDLALEVGVRDGSFTGKARDG